ncbi:MAG: radical SAM protein [Polyangia bacterium]
MIVPPAERDADREEAVDMIYQEVMSKGRTSAHIPGLLRHVLGDQRVHLYGALGRTARLLSVRLREAGIAIESGYDRRVLDGVDNSAGFPVKPSAKVRELGNGDILLIAAGSAELVESMREELKGLSGDVLPRTLDGRKLTYLAQNGHCAELTRKGEHEELLTCISYHTKPFRCEYFKRATEDLAAREVPQCVRRDGSDFNSVGYLVSEWCNLRCAQCCEAVPYLNSKEAVSADEVVADLTKLVAAIRFLHRLDIVGGEPFAHRDIARIVREVRGLPGIGYIAVFTNGTVLPSDELCDALVSKRIVVTNSDYSTSLDDNRRTKIVRTVEKLRSRGVKVVQIGDRYWFNLLVFKPNGVLGPDLRRNYSDCFLESCRRLYRGTLYHCAVQAAGIKLGKLPRRNVLDLHRQDDEATSAELEAFEHEEFIESCRSCPLPAGPAEVVAARQLDPEEVRAFAR